ncbi:MAG: hypothetical protein MSA55_00745, partial [Coriobacteriaceae bacterium]|nr:hypothetical protein [Coriobacteriaceae bacterium]
MLAQLRRKFIALNMTIATLVLLVVFGAICVIDYQTSVSDVLGQLNLTVDRTAESISTGKGAEDVRASNNESENDLLGSAPSKNAQSESEGTATNPAEDTANAQD